MGFRHKLRLAFSKKKRPTPAGTPAVAAEAIKTRNRSNAMSIVGPSPMATSPAAASPAPASPAWQAATPQRPRRSEVSPGSNRLATDDAYQDEGSSASPYTDRIDQDEGPSASPYTNTIDQDEGPPASPYTDRIDQDEGPPASPYTDRIDQDESPPASPYTDTIFAEEGEPAGAEATDLHAGEDAPAGAEATDLHAGEGNDVPQEVEQASEHVGGENAAARPPEVASEPARTAVEDIPYQYLMSAPETAGAGSRRKLKTRRLPDLYANETRDAEPFRGGADVWQRRIAFEHAKANKPGAAPTITSVATRYMDAAEQRKQGVRFAGGKLVNSNGELVDTSVDEKIVNGQTVLGQGPSGVGTMLGAGRGKHIFAMTKTGKMRMVDPWAARSVTPTADGGSQLGFVNHSSLVGGGKVAGAGELTVDKGELRQVSDASGHYMPDGKMVGQTLDELDENGVDMSRVDLKLVGKKHGQKTLIAPSHEFRSYTPKKAEKKMRRRRKRLQQELEGAVFRRDLRTGGAAVEPTKVTQPDVFFDMPERRDLPYLGGDADLPYSDHVPGIEAPRSATSDLPYTDRFQPPGASGTNQTPASDGGDMPYAMNLPAVTPSAQPELAASATGRKEEEEDEDGDFDGYFDGYSS